MNTLLQSELQSQDKDLLQTLVLLEEYIFQISKADQKITSTELSLDNLEIIIEQ